MVLSLSSHNVIQYLRDVGLCSSEDGVSADSALSQSSRKNWNLLVSLAGNRKLLVKQERYIENETTPHEFFNEWLFHQLLQRFPVLGSLPAIASSVIHFDEENAILVRNYLTEYVALDSFYQTKLDFPEAIAKTIGNNLGVLHRVTFNHREYRDFMATAPQGMFRYQCYNPAQGIDSIGPEIFGTIPINALKFYLLYQQSESLEAAIAELAQEWTPSCLTHNDLKLENILIHSRWDQLDNCLIRLIDWEACAWGDPAYDLGTLIASYLKIWLDSLIIEPFLELDESLHLAMIPIEILQPSILALTQAYLNIFPMILDYRRDFIVRVLQFTGLVLVHQVYAKIKHDKYFDSASISTLHMAKNLLIGPKQSVVKVFGISEPELIRPFAQLPQLQDPENQQNLLRLFYKKTHLHGC